MWCRDVSRRYDVHGRACLCLPSVHFILHSRKYYTCSIGHFLTHLPSKTHLKCPWSGTWISLHQHYHHVHQIFSTDGHFQCPVHRSAFHVSVTGSVKYPFEYHPLYLHRWLRIQ